MSVLIKGMKMPENCLECEIRAYDANAGEEYCPFSQMECLSIGLQKNCPVVEVPEPHGDLIDRDEVRKAVIHHLGIKGEEYLLPAEKSVFGNIIKAKAVIKAEGSNDTRKAKGD